MKIRQERPGETGAIGALHRAAFGGDHGVVVAALVDDLRKLEGVSLVAVDGGDVVGHAMFSPGLLDAPRQLVDVQVLSPVAVKPSAQGRGIATGLIRHGVELVSARRTPAVFLEGDPRFYARLGFVAAEPRGFRKPSLRIPDAAFQVMILPAFEQWMTGTLVYPEAFWRHDLVGLRDPV